ncbi:class I adenylate-forming enzyme family protein [Sorangium sp. So ce363]|uniref:class I adenylate-forming enzyme family protein n=1 Tax=Sorangium sp. So ce363 TaxID=3133304 RepID=UPI003F60ED3A
MSTDFDLAHSYGGVPFDRTLPIEPTILAHVAARARSQGDDPFLTAARADGGVVTLTYRDLEALSRRVSSWARRRLGVGSGDVLALVPTNEASSVVALFGALRAGCALLLLSPADPAGRLRQLTEALGAKAVLRSPDVAADVLPEAIPVPEAASLEDGAASDPDPAVEPRADALFFGTSGSTATSKLVAQSHYAAAVNAEALRRHHGLKRGDRLLGCLPIHHVNCLHFTIFATLAAGAHAVLAHAFDPFGYPRLVERFRPRIASVVPSILEALLGMWRQPALPGDFEYFVSAAAPLTARTARAVREKLGARILQGYGLTETTNFSTTMPADLSEDAYRAHMLDVEIPSIGTALYGNEVAVLDRGGERAAPGEIGEICMRGHNVMTCYAGNDEATAEAFRGGWFHSGDLGYEIEDRGDGRRYFTITGRSKNIAKVRGESVSLDEMDRVLRALPHVEDAACVALQHPLLGEEIIAAIVGSQGAVGDAEILAHLRAVFAPTVLPRRLVRLEAIPRTPTGKLLRADLARRLAALVGAAPGR